MTEFIAGIDNIFGRKSDEDLSTADKLKKIELVMKYYKEHDDKKAFSVHLVKILIPALILVIIALVAVTYALMKHHKASLI